ncbi:MAG: hypothetical protein VKS61_17260 [Candidatus Sericytochromatia bacterium]|nr:hypothetical protein [Candidatus Sericytochromatia bacterium]
MLTRSLRAIALAAAILAAAGCGVGGPLGADPYGYGAGYGAEAGYGAGYGGDLGGSYSGGYGGDTGGSYESNYGSGYGTGTSGTSYGMAYGGSDAEGPTGPGASPRAITSGSYGDYGASYGDDAVVRARASASPTPPPVAATRLSAWVAEVKEPGFFARLRGGKISARVEVENPADRTLSGRVQVRFLDDGNPTGVIQTRKVTLAPGEKQVLTFTVEAGRLDDAEASVETLGTPAGSGVVVDRAS